MIKENAMINVTAQFSNNSEHNSTSKFEKIFDGDIGLVHENRLHYMIALCTVNVFLCITASFGNIAILLTLWKTPSLHSAGNVLLASLAVSDLSVGLFIEPLLIALVIKNPPFHSTNVTVFEFLGIFLCSASFCSTTAIGIDRFLALQLHLRYKAVVTPVRVTWAVVTIWINSLMLSCARLWTDIMFYTPIASITFVFLVVNFVVYLKIYLIIRRHRLQISHEHHHQQQWLGEGNIFRKMRKSAINTFLVCILLLCCYMPHIMLIVYTMSNSSVSFEVLKVTTTFILLNSSLNPALYCWRIRAIRIAMKLTMRCCFLMI